MLGRVHASVVADVSLLPRALCPLLLPSAPEPGRAPHTLAAGSVLVELTRRWGQRSRIFCHVQAATVARKPTRQPALSRSYVMPTGDVGVLCNDSVPSWFACVRGILHGVYQQLLVYVQHT